jgi:2-oxo-4-hydroxy-4-carboxy-5-ureidoimidazoline decarboxylase
MKTLGEVNAMTLEDFVAAFGDVAEHSPWVAEQAASARPFTSRDAMIAAFDKALQWAGQGQRLALIRAHPNLAAKAKLTDDSTREQASAGLASLSPDEFTQFMELNRQYTSKFDFPFIFAVKGAAKKQILASFSERIKHDAEIELATALCQISRIFRFRIEDRVKAQ